MSAFFTIFLSMLSKSVDVINTCKSFSTYLIILLFLYLSNSLNISSNNNIGSLLYSFLYISISASFKQRIATLCCPCEP